LLQRQALVATSNRQLALLGEYFTTLQQFAREDIAGSFEAATGDLTQSINDVGAAIETNPQAKATISEPERMAIGKLAGLVAQQIHGAVLTKILTRDAALIGTQLTLISKTLTTYSSWIGDRMDFELADEYKTSVVRPFVDSGDLPGGWDHDVREYLNRKQLSNELSNAELASKKMERYWAEYLAGRTSLGDLADDLKDIKKLLDAIAGVRAGRGEKT
jgi:ATP phosphoribosyltransferase regulatory subunit HisZ